MKTFRFPRTHLGILEQAIPVICTDEVLELELVGATIEILEAAMETIPKQLRIGILAGLSLLDLSTTLQKKYLGRRFVSLPPEEAEEAFARFYNNPISHPVAKIIKGVVAMSYYELPEVEERLGYRAQAWVDKVNAERQRSFQNDIISHEKLLRTRNINTSHRKKKNA